MLDNVINNIQNIYYLMKNTSHSCNSQINNVNDMTASRNNKYLINHWFIKNV